MARQINRASSLLKALILNEHFSVILIGFRKQMMFSLKQNEYVTWEECSQETIHT